MERLLNFLIKTSMVLAIFLVPLVWSPWTLEAFEFPKQYLLVGLLLFGFLAWLANMVLYKREISLARTPLNLPLFLFFVVLVLSTFFSNDRWSSLFGFYGRFSDGVLGMIAALGLFFLIVNTQPRPSSLVRPFLFSSFLAVVIGYLSLFGVFNNLSGLSVLNIAPGFNTVAGTMEGFSLFLAFLVSFVALRVLKPPTHFIPFAGSTLLLLLSFGLLLLLDFSVSWGVLLIGLVLVLLAGLLQRSLTGEPVPLRRLLAPGALLFLSLVFLFSPLKVPGFEQHAISEPRLSHGLSWSIAVGTLGESTKNLLLGSGPGTFALDFSLQKPKELNTTPFWQTRFDRAGDFAPEVLATTGILGFLFFMGAFFWFFLISFAFLKGRANLPLVFGTLILFLSQFLYYQTTVTQISLWMFLALSVVSLELPKRETRFSLTQFPEFGLAAKLLLLLFTFLVGGAFFWGVRSWLADAKYSASLQVPASNPALKIERALEASRLNPWQAEYRMFLSRAYLGRALAELQKPEDARNQEHISKDVQRAIAYARGDTIEEERIAGAIELSPNRVAAWETLGNLYQEITFATGALEWGIVAFENALALEPTNPVLYTELGKLLVAKQDYEKASAAFLKAVEVKPDYVEAQLQLALLQEKQGEIEAALQVLKEVSLRYPLYGESAFQLGRVLYNTGQVEQAILQFEHVLNIAPNHSNALFALGVAYESQGRIEEAIGTFQQVLQLNPNNQAVQEKLQRLQE